MRTLIRTLLLLLLFAALFPFLYPWQDGKPLLSWSALRAQFGAPAMPNLSLPKRPWPSLTGIESGGETGARQPHQPVVVYRWQGADGSAQFSNEPPAPGVAYEVVEVNPDANLIQAPVQPPVKESRSGTATQGAEGAPAMALPSPLTVSPTEAMQLLKDARKVQELSVERLRQQEAQLP
jgi:hypothetical protein